MVFAMYPLVLPVIEYSVESDDGYACVGEQYTSATKAHRTARTQRAPLAPQIVAEEEARLLDTQEIAGTPSSVTGSCCRRMMIV
jgi:hypothetical protein